MSPAACQLVPLADPAALEDDGVGPAQPGQVEGDGGADDAAADHDRPRSRGRRLGGPRVEARRRQRRVAQPFLRGHRPPSFGMSVSGVVLPLVERRRSGTGVVAWASGAARRAGGARGRRADDERDRGLRVLVGQHGGGGPGGGRRARPGRPGAAHRRGVRRRRRRRGPRSSPAPPCSASSSRRRRCATASARTRARARRRTSPARCSATWLEELAPGAGLGGRVRHPGARPVRQGRARDRASARGRGLRARSPSRRGSSSRGATARSRRARSERARAWGEQLARALQERIGP